MKSYNYNVIKLNITSGFSDECFEYDGERIFYKEGVSPIEIKLDNKSNDAIPLNPKETLIAPFERFYISAPPSAETITLYISKPAEISLDSKQIDVETVHKIVDVKPANSLNIKQVNVTAGSVVLVAEAKDDRKSITIRNGSQSETCYISSSDGINIFPLLPMESMTFDYYKGNIYVKGGSVDITVYVIEEFGNA